MEDKHALNAESLMMLGFRNVAEWIYSSGSESIAYRVNENQAEEIQPLLDMKNSLYAFVHGDQVKYIGKTSRTIRKRFTGYMNPGNGQTTNLRCNANIRDLLTRGEQVHILVFNPVSLLRYGDFEVNLAAGLEDSLIAEFYPPWNGRERNRPLTEEAEREEKDEPNESVGNQIVSPSVSTRESKPIAATGRARFEIPLGDTYFYRGLINPGSEASRLLGAHDEPIEISFGGGDPSVISKIDRKANASGSVRIVGNNRTIAKWFQHHFSLGDLVTADILSRNHIMLHTKM